MKKSLQWKSFTKADKTKCSLLLSVCASVNSGFGLGINLLEYVNVDDKTPLCYLVTNNTIKKKLSSLSLFRKEKETWKLRET